jgi:hypothetical protein
MKQVIAFICLLGCISCSTSRITSSWTKPDVSTNNIHKILVLALTGSNDNTLRAAMEQNTVDELRGLGYDAVSAYTVYGPDKFDTKDEQAAIDRFRQSNVDAILTVVLLDKNKERYYVPGRVEYSPYAVYHNRFWGYYTTLYDRVYTPGYYTTNTRFFWESNLYNMDNRDLLYSVQTESFDPASASSLGKDYGKLIVRDMVKSGVLKQH